MRYPTIPTLSNNVKGCKLEQSKDTHIGHNNWNSGSMIETYKQTSKYKSSKTLQQLCNPLLTVTVYFKKYNDMSFDR